MSKPRMTGTDRGNTAPISALTQHELSREQKRQIWAEMMKRKDEAKQQPLDKFYKGVSYKTAKSITAFYLAASGKKINKKTILDNYDVGLSTYQRYYFWFSHGTFSGSSQKISQYVTKNRDALLAAIKKSKSPSIDEINRLYSIANPKYFNIVAGKVYESRSWEHKKKLVDLAVDQAKATGEIPVISFDVDQKPLTKSDVVTGVITGALIGAAMTAYLFMSNGAI